MYVTCVTKIVFFIEKCLVGRQCQLEGVGFGGAAQTYEILSTWVCGIIY